MPAPCFLKERTQKRILWCHDWP